MTYSTPSSPPLWRTILRAYDTSSIPPEVIEALDEEGTGAELLTDRYGYAAELSAAADWIEEKHKMSPGIIAVGAREVAAQFREEARRAESGE
jgi:hypothetical protein